jgi:preprotein translocase subunit YajC
VQFLIIMALMLGVMYVLMIRPQRQKQAQQQDMIANARVGDDVLTTGGIYATITEVEGDDVAVEIAEGVTVHMTRRGIAAVLPPEQEEDEEVEDDDAEELDDELTTQASGDGDEGAVTDGEEAVRAGAAEVSTGDDRR